MPKSHIAISILCIFTIEVTTACSSDLVFQNDDENTRIDFDLHDQNLNDAQNDSELVEKSPDMMLRPLERIIKNIDTYRPPILPRANDFTSVTECVENFGELCRTLQLYDYIVFGKIRKLAPIEITPEEKEVLLLECSNLHWRGLVITIEVYEDIKKEKTIEDFYVEVYVKSLNSSTPSLSFDREDQLVWSTMDPPFQEGDIIGMLGSREVSTQFIIAGPLLKLEIQGENIIVNSQEGKTCWGDNQFQNIELTELRTRINKCKLAGQYENTYGVLPSSNRYRCVQ